MLDPSVDVMVSRDLDSRISSREQVVVVEWLEQSNLPFHIIRDHPGHFYSEWSSLVHGTILGYLKYFSEILGGLWGARMDSGYRDTLSTLMKSLIDEVRPHHHNVCFISIFSIFSL